MVATAGGTFSETLAWLLDPSDPGVRAQALIRLCGRAPNNPDVKATQENSLLEGSIARVLNDLVITADQDSYEKLFEPRYATPYHRLIALADMGAPSGDNRISYALERILTVFLKPDGGFGKNESHLCVTGNVVRAASHFGRGADPRVGTAVKWLVEHQCKDGGWNCFPEDEPGGTVDSWEPLAALGSIPPPQRSSAIQRAIERGVEFLLEQRLGVDAGYEPWRRIHFPRHYYYDFLLGLELATNLGNPHDARLKPAVELLKSKSTARYRWMLDITHPDVDPEGDPPYKPIWNSFLAKVVRLEIEPPEIPSRWATLAAMSVIQQTEAVGSTKFGGEPKHHVEK